MKRYIVLTCLFFVAMGGYFAAKAADYKLEVLDFSELKVTDGINVDYICSQDSAGWVYFSCEPEMSSKLMFSNNKSCLHVQVAADDEILTDLPTVRVYSSFLTKVENQSDSTVRVLSNSILPSFKVRVIGNGTIKVANIEANSVEGAIATGKGHIVFTNGVAKTAKFRNVGTGPIEGGGLKAQEVKAFMLGTGDIDCTALKVLTIYGAGTGKVYYSGNPEKVVNRSIGVKSFPVVEAGN